MASWKVPSVLDVDGPLPYSGGSFHLITTTFSLAFTILSIQEATTIPKATRIWACADVISGRTGGAPQRIRLGSRTCSTPRSCQTTPTSPASPRSSSRPPFRSGRGCSQEMSHPPLQPRPPRSTLRPRSYGSVCAPRNGCSWTGLTTPDQATHRNARRRTGVLTRHYASVVGDGLIAIVRQSRAGVCLPP